ncbi:hypothetical protein MTO96_016318 [Rhipicephalus appendiculatus]
MEETLLRAEKEIEQANSSETKLQLILHVGTTDILNENEPDRSIEQLKQKLTAWSQDAPQHHYIICATPELASRGPHTQSSCQEWNKQANELCTMLGPQVEFLSTTGQLNEDSLEDIHYTEATGIQVGHLLAIKATTFLGVTRDHHSSPPTGTSTTAKTGSDNENPSESYDYSIHTTEPTKSSQARTGSLVTPKRRHELFDTDPSCRLCGATEETIAHVLQACPRLHDRPRTSPSLAELLGLSGQTDETHFDRVNSTKTLLLRWERLSRGAETTLTGETPLTPPQTTHTGTPPAWFQQDNTEQ